MNIKILGFAFVAACVTLGCASTPGTDAQKMVQADEPVQAAEIVQGTDEGTHESDAMRCKWVQKTGTRFQSKVCATNAEWKASEEAAQNTTEAMQRRPQRGKEEGG